MTMSACASAVAALSASPPSTFTGTSRPFSPLGCSPFNYGVSEVRRPSGGTRTRCRRADGVSLGGSRVSFSLSKLRFDSMRVTCSGTDSHKSGLVKVLASIEEGVKSTETTSSEEGQSSTSNSDAQKLESPPPSPASPFASGKISSRIAAKQVGDSQQPVSASTSQKAGPVKSPATAVNPPAAGQLSVNAASQLKVTKPPSVFTVPTKPADGMPASPFAKPRTSKPESPPNPFRKTPLVPADWEKAGARPAGSGKRVLDAFREGDKGGTTTKFGQPMVPKNIFDEVRRTPEEIAADAFKFQIDPGQLFLVGSFLVIIAVMFGTVFFVWKVGAIHYNEY